MAKKCPENEVERDDLAATMSIDKIHVDRQKELSNMIEDMWVEQDMSPIQICNELAINNLQFNELVVKYKIVKN